MTYSFRLIMQRRRIPILDPFFDRMSLLLWPRFKQIVDSNIKSIKTANFKKLGPVDLSPHYVSRRFAELVASISSLQGRSSITMNQSQSKLFSIISIFKHNICFSSSIWSQGSRIGNWSFPTHRPDRYWRRRRTYGSAGYSINENRNYWYALQIFSFFLCF